MAETQVLIAGAGPTGLVLALWLTRLGVRVRIVDKAVEPGTTSRAMAVHARTLELYDQLDGMGREVAAAGVRAERLNLWVEGKQRAEAFFGDLRAQYSPYPYILIYPQDAHERLLVRHLEAAGVRVDRSCELTDFTDDESAIHATIRRADGSTEQVDAAYLAGCDGAHSTVREKLNTGFPGGTYEQLFFVADVIASGPMAQGEPHVSVYGNEFTLVFPLGPRLVRVIGIVPGTVQKEVGAITWDDVKSLVGRTVKLEVEHVNWFSTYHTHHRVTDHFRVGRAFLCGDAAHVHSPAGGQGMNTGIGDAVNLSWKLAEVLHGRARPALLDTYESERIAFARTLVRTTDRLFAAVTGTSLFAKFVRQAFIPIIAPEMLKVRAFRRFMFRTISQIKIQYRHSALSSGTAGEVQGGDRLPWVPLPDGADNFAPLRRVVWQTHFYGDVPASLVAHCTAIGLPLCTFPWTDTAHRAGLKPGALYLVRPDGYVALADPAPSPQRLDAYLSARGISVSAPTAP